MIGGVVVGMIILNTNRDNINDTVLTRGGNFRIFISSVSRVGPVCTTRLRGHSVRFRRGRRATRHVLSTNLIVGDPNVPSGTPLIERLYRGKIRVVDRVRFTNHCASTGAVYVANDGNGAAAAVLACFVLSRTNCGINLTNGINGDFT